MDLQPSTVRHLAFIKYLYRVGIGQSESTEPLSGAGLLTFHDAIELFLHLACEQLNIVTNKPEFKDYLGLLRSGLGVELSQAAAMKRLNQARVALKHHGILPAKHEIEAIRASTTSFFEDNTPLIFKIAFSTISMSDFVQPEQARENLKAAENLLEDGKLAEALGNTAIAFHQMRDGYEFTKLDDSYRSPFFFGEDLTFHNSLAMGLGIPFNVTEKNWDQKQFEQKLGEFVDKVRESLEAMQDAIKILAMGIDFRRYSKFRFLTPSVSRNMHGNYFVNNRSYKPELTAADVRFCIEFVVEAAVKLQEFDYRLPSPFSNQPTDKTSN